jgi:hypothetical protein
MEVNHIIKLSDAKLHPYFLHKKTQRLVLCETKHCVDSLCMERVMGIEPTTSAWKAEVLPLNYTRMSQIMLDFVE